METIPAVFARQAATLGSRPLFLVKRGTTYQSITWQQAAEDVHALSAFLLTQQVNAGDRVLILSENRPEWGIADLAIQSVGAWTVPVYPSLTADDLRAICADCQPVVAIASSPEQLQKLREVSGGIGSPRTMIAMASSSSSAPHVVSWTDALAKGREVGVRFQELAELRLNKLTPQDTATILYTSGTTGEPKGVLLSHQNFLSNVTACLEAVPVNGTDVHLSFLPLSHVFERMGGWYLMLSVGACVAYAESMDTIPHDMRAVRPTVMLGVPRFFEKLYARIQEGVRQSPPLKRTLATWAMRVGRACTARTLAGQPLPRALSARRWLAERLVFHKVHARLGGRLRFFISGGAPLSKEIGEFFYSVGVVILEGYGLTETSPVIAVNRLPIPRFGSVGKPIPGVEVRIADDGEILVRGPLVMQGYYRKPEETGAAIIEGWFHTGDIGRLDDAGFLYITDRKKDLIKTAGGKFVAPQKLENLLTADPLIAQAFIYGDRQPYCVALIVPAAEPLRRYATRQGIPGDSPSAWIRDPRVHAFYWSLVQERQATLASFEQVKKMALLDHELSQGAGELTPTLKTKRAVVAQRYESLLRDLYQP